MAVAVTVIATVAFRTSLLWMGGGGIVVRRWRLCRSPLVLFLAATIVARPLARRRATMVDYLEELGATVVGGIFLAATAFQHNKA